MSSWTPTRRRCSSSRPSSWRKLAGEPIWNDWVKRMEAKGHPEAREILNTTLELLKN